jgi:DNA-binding NarL/FixJ family response regulator
MSETTPITSLSAHHATPADTMTLVAEEVSVNGRTRYARLQVPDAVDSLVRSDVEVVLVEPDGPQESSLPAEFGATVAEALRHGRRVRVLFGSRPLGPAATRQATGLAAQGAEVRVVDLPVPRLLLVDLRVALMPEPAGGCAVATIAQPHIVQLLYGLADLLWAAAMPLPRVCRTVAPQGDTAAYGPLQRRIVQMLAKGAKDETMARSLGISVRTCRRHIAEILNQLGAVSRFQAGANATRLGLLDPNQGDEPCEDRVAAIASDRLAHQSA